MSNEISVYVALGIGGSPNIPFKKHPLDAGWDLYTSRQSIVYPNERINIHTDIHIGIPKGWYGQIKPRSSTMHQTGLLVLEGVIDHTFRGELFYQVYNPTKNAVRIDVNRRLAQLIFLPVPDVEWLQVAELTPTERGPEGFGSTGR